MILSYLIAISCAILLYYVFFNFYTSIETFTSCTQFKNCEECTKGFVNRTNRDEVKCFWNSSTSKCSMFEDTGFSSTCPISNVYLNKHVRFNDGTIAYVNTNGVIRAYTSADIYQFNKGKNGCPNNVPVQINKRWNYVPGQLTTDLSPPMLVGPVMTRGESCSASFNPYLNRAVKFNNDVYAFVNDSGIIRPFNSKNTYDSNKGKNGCPSSTPIEIDEKFMYVQGQRTTTVPSMVVGSEIKLNEHCVNPYLNKNLLFKNGVYAYVNNNGVIRRYPSTTLYNSIIGKNGCPNNTPINIDINWNFRRGTFTTTNPPMIVGADMASNDVCNVSSVRCPSWCLFCRTCGNNCPSFCSVNCSNCTP